MSHGDEVYGMGNIVNFYYKIVDICMVTEGN